MGQRGTVPADSFSGYISPMIVIIGDITIYKGGNIHNYFIEKH